MAYPGIVGVFIGLVEPLFPYTFDPLLTPLLAIGGTQTGALLTIAVVSLVVSLIIIGARYFIMDMDRYHELRERQKSLNERMKDKDAEDLAKDGGQFGEMMDLMIEQMQLTMKPTLVTFPLIFLVLPWMYVTFTPIVTAVPANGDFTGELVYNGVSVPVTVSNQTGNATAVIDGQERAVGDTFTVDGLTWKVKEITVQEDSAEMKAAAVIWYSPIGLPGTGKDVGWLGTYILISLVGSMALGKYLGLH